MILAQARYFVSGELIAALIFRVSGVPLKPMPGDGVSRDKIVEFQPEWLIFDRFFVRGFPPVAFPIVNPLSDALAEVLRVGIEVNETRGFECLECFNSSLELHLVIGRLDLSP